MLFFSTVNECFVFIENIIFMLGFDWAALPRDSLVVDVGGGVGSQTLTLAKAHEHLKFVVQDRESVISGPGAKVCAASKLHLLRSHSISL